MERPLVCWLKLARENSELMNSLEIGDAELFLALLSLIKRKVQVHTQELVGLFGLTLDALDATGPDTIDILGMAFAAVDAADLLVTTCAPLRDIDNFDQWRDYFATPLLNKGQENIRRIMLTIYTHAVPNVFGEDALTAIFGPPRDVDSLSEDSSSGEIEEIEEVSEAESEPQPIKRSKSFIQKK